MNGGELVLSEIKQSDDLSRFCCGDADLDEFLKDEAMEYHRLCLAKTYLCRRGRDIVGFFSVAMDSIKEEKLEETFKIRNIPAFKIARLAVDVKYQKSGIGRILLTTILAEAQKMSEVIGCRLVTVDSKRESIDFYIKHKFKHTHKSEKQVYPTLYLDLLRT